MAERESLSDIRRRGGFGRKRTREDIDREREELERQRVEWEAYSDKELLAGRCPYSGGILYSDMDAWQRRVLVCGPCDCFGYPLVMSDAGDTYGVLHPEIDAAQKRRASGDLTEAESEW